MDYEEYLNYKNFGLSDRQLLEIANYNEFIVLDIFKHSLKAEVENDLCL